jgi:hypothetical protein
MGVINMLAYFCFIQQLLVLFVPNYRVPLHVCLLVSYIILNEKFFVLFCRYCMLAELKKT